MCDYDMTYSGLYSTEPHSPEKAAEKQVESKKEKEKTILRELNVAFNREIEKQDPTAKEFNVSVSFMHQSHLSKANIEMDVFKKFIDNLQEKKWEITAPAVFSTNEEGKNTVKVFLKNSKAG
jgi:cellobiose-specific phosphotransferase system component IIA